MILLFSLLLGVTFTKWYTNYYIKIKRQETVDGVFGVEPGSVVTLDDLKQ